VDGQANLTTALDFDPDEIERPVSDLLTDPEAKVKDYIIKTKFKNVELIPSSQQTFASEKKII